MMKNGWYKTEVTKIGRNNPVFFLQWHACTYYKYICTCTSNRGLLQKNGSGIKHDAMLSDGMENKFRGCLQITLSKLNFIMTLREG